MLAKIFRAYSPKELILSFVMIAVVALLIAYFLVFNLLVKPIDSLLNPVYKEGLVGDVVYINPLLYNFDPVNRDIIELVYDGLLRYNPEKKQFEPGLASFAINDDVTVYTVNLKKDVFWHDGKPVTADDVIFTFDSILKNTAYENGLVKAAFVDVVVEKLDENTVTFTLSQPNAFFLANLLMPILPKHVFEDVALSVLTGDVPEKYLIGSGPYMFEDKIESTGSTTFKLKAFSDYYFGKPKLKDVELMYFASNDELVDNLPNLNSIPLVPAELGIELFEDYTFKNYYLPQYQAIFLNQQSPLLETERMRKIIKNAFDKQAIADSLTSKETIAGPYFFLEEFDVVPGRDLTVLRNELDDLGYLESDGIRVDSEGRRLSFVLLVRKYTHLAQQLENEKVVEHILETAKELSINVDVVYAESEEFAAKLFNKDYDWVLYGQDFAYNLDAFAFWHSSQAGVGGLNLANFQSVSADAILDQLRNTRDQDEQRDLLEKLNVTLKAEAPAVFLYTQKYRFAFDNSVKNRTILPDYATTADRFFNVIDWELD